MSELFGLHPSGRAANGQKTPREQFATSCLYEFVISSVLPISTTVVVTVIYVATSK